MENDNVKKLAAAISGMTDDQLKEFAGKRAAKAILTPSEKQGQARSKVPEELAHLLARLYQDERSQRFENDVNRRSMPEKLFRQLESFCQQNSTTFVPFDMLAGIKDQGQDPNITLANALDFLFRNAKLAYYCSDRGPQGASDIMLAFGEIIFNMQRVLNLFGWTFDDLKLNVRREMDIREKEAKNKN